MADGEQRRHLRRGVRGRDLHDERTGGVRVHHRELERARGCRGRAKAIG